MSKALVPHPETDFSDVLGRDMSSLIPTIGWRACLGSNKNQPHSSQPQTSQQHPIPVRQSHRHSSALIMVATAASINISIFFFFSTANTTLQLPSLRKCLSMREVRPLLYYPPLVWARALGKKVTSRTFRTLATKAPVSLRKGKWKE